MKNEWARGRTDGGRPVSRFHSRRCEIDGGWTRWRWWWGVGRFENDLIGKM